MKTQKLVQFIGWSIELMNRDRMIEMVRDQFFWTADQIGSNGRLLGGIILATGQ